MNRRKFLGSVLAGKLLIDHTINSNIVSAIADPEREPFFTRRCFTIWVEDLLKWDWPQKAHAAGINTIATHHDPDTIVAYLKTEKGQIFFNDCKRLGIAVEHSLHAYSSLLPRQLFDKHPTLFRMNKDGQRTNDSNFCVSNKNTLEVVCENAVKYGQLLPSTSGRYFYTYDDAKHLCSCPECIKLSASEQTLTIENAIIKTLRKYVNPEALISHAAYVYTMNAPKQIKPEPGVFLEWAPITRTYDHSITDRNGKDGEHGRLVDRLYENMEVFGNTNSQVFEYWFDSYRASGWKTKEENWVRAPWNAEVLFADLTFYKSMGINSITSVTCWTNQDYVDRFGEPPVMEYGNQLLSF